MNCLTCGSKLLVLFTSVECPRCDSPPKTLWTVIWTRDIPRLKTEGRLKVRVETEENVQSVSEGYDPGVTTILRLAYRGEITSDRIILRLHEEGPPGEAWLADPSQLDCK